MCWSDVIRYLVCVLSGNEYYIRENFVTSLRWENRVINSLLDYWSLPTNNLWPTSTTPLPCTSLTFDPHRWIKRFVKGIFVNVPYEKQANLFLRWHICTWKRDYLTKIIFNRKMLSLYDIFYKHVHLSFLEVNNLL